MISSVDQVIDGGDILVIGSGLAGLMTALTLTDGPAPHPKVCLLTLDAPGQDAASAWAQGGIAAAMGPKDTPAQHTADTMAAGAGIVDRTAAETVCTEIIERVGDLVRFGVAFDRTDDGTLHLGREAAHSRHRIVKVSGDKAGAAITQQLVARVTERPAINILTGLTAFDLAQQDGRVTGVTAIRLQDGLTVRIHAPRVVLATGGTAALFAMATPSMTLTGSGLGMAARAGAQIADPEFVQFHPTAMTLGRDPAPLATEALRGDGAVLVTASGDPIMRAIHPDKDLAPRDVVARAVHARLAQGERVFLDCRDAIGRAFPHRFPTVYAMCMDAGLDPRSTPIPVAPAAHYHMGGVASDLNGRTSLEGLWACGEVASTGLHGANRLASNSLAEALVMGTRTAHDLLGTEISHTPHAPLRCASMSGMPLTALAQASPLLHRLRQAMSAHVGVIRHAQGLRMAARTLRDLARAGRQDATHANIIAAATLIIAAAAQRIESRGGHFRADYPSTDENWARRTQLTLAQAETLRDDLAETGHTVQDALA